MLKSQSRYKKSRFTVISFEALPSVAIDWLRVIDRNRVVDRNGVINGHWVDHRAEEATFLKSFLETRFWGTANGAAERGESHYDG